MSIITTLFAQCAHYINEIKRGKTTNCGYDVCSFCRITESTVKQNKTLTQLLIKPSSESISKFLSWYAHSYEIFIQMICWRETKSFVFLDFDKIKQDSWMRATKAQLQLNENARAIQYAHFQIILYAFFQLHFKFKKLFYVFNTCAQIWDWQLVNGN